MDTKKIKRYKFYVWVFVVLTLASYINSIYDIIVIIYGLFNK